MVLVDQVLYVRILQLPSFKIPIKKTHPASHHSNFKLTL